MTKTEALRLALEAFEYIENNYMSLPAPATKAINAIREALAQPEQEPFGWLYSLIVEGTVVNEKFTGVNWDTKYEPFGRHGVDHGGKVTKTPLYTTPPHRKPLTEKRIEELYSFWVVDCQDIVGFARAVERTVKGEV